MAFITETAPLLFFTTDDAIVGGRRPTMSLCYDNCFMCALLALSNTN